MFVAAKGGIAPGFAWEGVPSRERSNPKPRTPLRKRRTLRSKVPVQLKRVATKAVLKRRNNGMSKFQKGNSGGPGRPRGSGHNQWCAEWAEASGLNFLMRVADGKVSDISFAGKRIKTPLRIRVKVAKYLVDRGIGKATPHNEVNAESGETVLGFICRVTKAEE